MVVMGVVVTAVVTAKLVTTVVTAAAAVTAVVTVAKTKTAKIRVVVLEAADVAGVEVEAEAKVEVGTVLPEGNVLLVMNWRPSRYVDLKYVNLPTNLMSIRE